MRGIDEHGRPNEYQKPVETLCLGVSYYYYYFTSIIYSSVHGKYTEQVWAFT
jgi:hypothetical protein